MSIKKLPSKNFPPQLYNIVNIFSNRLFCPFHITGKQGIDNSLVGNEIRILFNRGERGLAEQILNNVW